MRIRHEEGDGREAGGSWSSRLRGRLREESGRGGGDPSRAAAPKSRVPSRLAAVIAAALAVRALYLLSYMSSPFPGVYFVDQLYYRSWALKIAGGEWFGRNVFEMAPLYAYLLGGAYRLLGDSNALVLPLQMLAGIVTVVLVWWCARELGGERPAFAAGMAAAVYGPLVYYECMIMKTFLEPLFVVAALAGGLAGARTGRARGFAAAGIFVGLACLVREVHVLLLAPLAVAAWRAGPGERAPVCRLLHVGVLLGGFLLAMTPSTVRNLAVSRSFELSTPGGGAVFYLAFGPQNTTGYYSAPDFVRAGPFIEAQDFREEAVFRNRRAMSWSESSHYWYREAWNAILSEPGRAARIVFLRAHSFFHDAEIPDSEDYRVTADYVPLLRFLPSFGVFAGVGFLGVVLLARQGGRALLPLAFAAVLFAEVLVTYYFGRYRVAFCAVWMIFVGVGISWLLSRERLRSGASRYGLGAAVAAVLLLSALSFRLPPGSEDWLPRQREDARKAMASIAGRLADLSSLRKEIAGGRGSAETLRALGEALEETGNYVEASRAYEEALRLSPDAVETRRSLVSLLGRMGEYERAAEQAGMILAARPGDAQSHYLMGAVLARLPSVSAVGEEADRFLGEAERELRAAVLLEPAAASARYQLGRVLYLRGNAPEALREIGRARQLEPGFPGADRSLRHILDHPEGES